MPLYGLIGYPLGHSFSKEYFTTKFKNENLEDCSFEAFPIPSIDLFPALLRENPSLRGLSVTIPYKEQVLKFITKQSEEVVAIGATNSIRVSGNNLVAYNTDITGFKESFLPCLRSFQKKALILGTGGASKAVQYVLNKLSIDFLLVSRNRSARNNSIGYTNIDASVMDEYKIIINCSPVGMSPAEELCPDIPYDHLGSDHYLYDLVYKPTETLFLKKGRAMGATVKNGYDMLLIQAEASWKIWNNVP